jgi:hypothetical protein
MSTSRALREREVIRRMDAANPRYRTANDEFIDVPARFAFEAVAWKAWERSVAARLPTLPAGLRAGRRKGTIANAERRP